MFSVTIRERSGQVYTFHFDKPEINIGRVKGNDVILPKQNISKRHATIRAANTRFVVEDMGSTNGTYVNGHRITSPVEVTADDKVYLGDFVMQFFAIAEDSPPLPGFAGPDLDEPVEVEDPILDERVELEDPILDDDVFVDLPIRRPPPITAEFAAADDDVDVDNPFADLDRGEIGGAARFSDDRRNGGVDFVLDDDGADGGADGAAAIFDAGNESTVAQLEDVAAAAGAEIAAVLAGHRTIGGAVVVQPSKPSPGRSVDVASSSEAASRTMATAPFAAVASSDPASDFAAIDDRMTGPVDGLSSALDALSGATAPSLALLPSEHGGPAPLLDLMPGIAHSERGDGYHDALAHLFVHARHELRALIGGDIHQLSDPEWSEIERRCYDLVDGARNRGDVSKEHDVDALRRDLVYELTWLGPLEGLLDDSEIERVEVDAFDRIAVVRAGLRQESPARFSCQAALVSAVERAVVAAGAFGVRAGRAHAEGALADGTTVRVVWPPLAPAGPVVVLRKPHRGVATLDALAARGWMSEPVAASLASAIAQGRNVAVVGANGEARRAVIEALAAAINNDARIVVIERDSPLCLEQAHVVRIDSAARDAGATGPIALAAHLGADSIVVAGCDTRLLSEVIELGCEGGPSMLSSWSAWQGSDATRRAAHAVMIASPGLEYRVAFERVAMALDVIVEVTQSGRAEGTVEVVLEVAGATDEGVELRPLGN